jgi:hypothetical protein
MDRIGLDFCLMVVFGISIVHHLRSAVSCHLLSSKGMLTNVTSVQLIKISLMPYTPGDLSTPS